MKNTNVAQFHQFTESSKPRSGKELNKDNAATERVDPTLILDNQNVFDRPQKKDPIEISRPSNIEDSNDGAYTFEDFLIERIEPVENYEATEKVEKTLESRRKLTRPEKKAPVERFRPSTTEKTNNVYNFDEYLVERIESSFTEQENGGAYKFEDVIVERIEPTDEFSFESSSADSRKVINRPEKKDPVERFRPTLIEQATEISNLPVERIKTTEKDLIYQPDLTVNQKGLDRPDKKKSVERHRPSITNNDQSYEFLSTNNRNVFRRPEKKVPVERYQPLYTEQENDAHQFEDSFDNNHVTDHTVVTERTTTSFLGSRKIIDRPNKKVPVERFRPSNKEVKNEIVNSNTDYELQFSGSSNNFDPDHRFESPTNEQSYEDEFNHVDRFLDKVLGLNKAVGNKPQPDATTHKPMIPKFHQVESTGKLNN